MLLILSSNIYTGFISFFNTILHFYLYDLVKEKTYQNIVIGGAAGTLPPLIGWVSVSASFDISYNLVFNNIYMDSTTFLGAIIICK